MGYVSSPEGNEFFGDELGVWWMVLSGHSFLAPFHFVSKPVDAIIAPESTSGGGVRQKEKLAVVECLDMFDSRPKYHRIPLPRSWSAQSLPRTWSIPLHSDIGPVFKPQKSSQTNFEVQVRERMYQDVSGSCQEFLICSEQGTPAYKFLHACEFGVILRAHDDSGQSPRWFGEFPRRHFWFSCSLVKAPDASVCWPEILQYLLLMMYSSDVQPTKVGLHVLNLHALLRSPYRIFCSIWMFRFSRNLEVFKILEQHSLWVYG